MRTNGNVESKIMTWETSWSLHSKRTEGDVVTERDLDNWQEEAAESGTQANKAVNEIKAGRSIAAEIDDLETGNGDWRDP